MKLQLLIVEDSEDDALLLVRQLQSMGHEIEHEVTCSAAGVRAALDRHEWDLITSDYAMPGFDGMSALAIVRERSLGTPFILISGKIGEERAVEALRRGATDYILKDNPQRLAPAVERALRESRERRQRAAAEKALQAAQERLSSVVASSPAVILKLQVQGNAITLSWWCARRWTRLDPARNLPGNGS
jgi:hypothetical protein